MDAERKTRNGHDINAGPGATPYERAVLGFPNYWYPACGARQVGARPLPLKLLGEPLVFLRRHGVAYAIQDECPHRGARMALGKYEFPGSNTITCRFHGMTYDVTNGACVAALTDGPDSPIVGKLRIRTYPVEERKGIVWVWMGKGVPVPLEEDVPQLSLRDDTLVKYNNRVVYGNWRYHAEIGIDAHLPTLHADALTLLNKAVYGYMSDYAPAIAKDEEVDDGEWLFKFSGKPVMQDDYPGLGTWPPKRLWRRTNRRPKGERISVQGARQVGLRLPGLVRVPNVPMRGAMLYEWYVPVDEDHYSYFQVTCHWPKNPAGRLWTHLWTRLWSSNVGYTRFNGQDSVMIGPMTEYQKRHGANRPLVPYRPDAFPLAWIQMCNERARGETPAPVTREGQEAITPLGSP